jgi:hypothetical protein
MGKPSQLGNAIAAVVLLATLPLCARALANEVHLSVLDRAEQRFAQTGDASTLEAALRRDAACKDNCPPRRLLLRAIGYGRLAEAAPAGPEQQQDIAMARALAKQGTAERPGWGEAIAVQAQLASLDPAGNSDAIAAFRASYRAAPYMREASLWRLRFGAAHWRQLDVSTQDAVLSEAIWLAAMSPKDQAEAQDAFGDSPAGLRFALLVSRLRIVETR